MSSSGALQTTAAARSGRWVSAAPTSRPPFEPPMTAELPVRRPALGDQVLAGGGEVVEHVLLALAHAGAVPLLAVLGAAAQVGHRPHAAGRDPGQRLRACRPGSARR